MSVDTVVSLPRPERWLLQCAASLVPAAERKEWLRAWQAEFWYLHRTTGDTSPGALDVIASLSLGLFRDALWLRTEEWRLAFGDTAALCVASLLALTLLSAVVDLALAGGWDALRLAMRDPHSLRDCWMRSLLAAPHVVAVLFATAARPHSASGSVRWLHWIHRQLFFAVKTLQVLLLAFLLSIAVWMPLVGLMPLTADLLQLLAFVVLALIGLRWAIRDQQERCKHCLRSLATPARVGRPSHNLLEWNGTELNCKHGHGLLSIPEMETSWCRNSRWIALDTP